MVNYSAEKGQDRRYSFNADLNSFIPWFIHTTVRKIPLNNLTPVNSSLIFT
jgi:hypothetical protein